MIETHGEKELKIPCGHQHIYCCKVVVLKEELNAFKSVLTEINFDLFDERFGFHTGG